VIRKIACGMIHPSVAGLSPGLPAAEHGPARLDVALRWLRLLLRVAAVAAGGGSDNAGIGLLAEQIASIGLWQWLLLVGSIAAGTSLVARLGQGGVAALRLLRPHGPIAGARKAAVSR